MRATEKSGAALPFFGCDDGTENQCRASFTTITTNIAMSTQEITRVSSESRRVGASASSSCDAVSSRCSAVAHTRLLLRCSRS